MSSKKITYRKEKGSRLTSNEVDQNFSYLDERIDKVSQKDYIIYNAGYTYNSTAVTASSGSVWLLDGEQYTNMMDFAFSVKPTSKDRYRVDVIYMDKAGVIDIKTGIESTEGYIKDRIDVLEYLLVYVNELGVQSVSASIDGDYISKLSLGWVDVDHKKPVLEATEQRSHINIVGGNVIIDTIANGIFEISVPVDFHDGYEVAIRNLRTSYLTLVNSSKLRIYTGQDYTLRPGEIITFKYDKREQCFVVSGALDIRLDWQNVDEIIGVDSMRMVVDSSAGDALNPNDLNTKLAPTILRYFKDYTSDAVGWQWSRFSGDETADKAWSKGKTKRVLELTPVDFTDAINKGNVSFMCEAVVNNATVAGVWVGKLVDTVKTIRIQSTGTQFKGKSPEYILLRAIANNIQVKKTEWFKDDVLTNINESVMVYNNQVSSFVVMKLRVTAVDGVVYEDSVTLSKVVDGTNGKDGVNGKDGKQGAAVVWTEWMTGAKHYNNEKEIYYIYHRPTQTVWKLKDGYNDIVAPANPDSRYVQQPHLEQVVTKVLVAEGANIAGFIFKNGKMVSQYPSPNNPDLILDGVKGEIIAKKLTIVPNSPADKFIDEKVKDGFGSIQVGGRNLIQNSGNFKTTEHWKSNGGGISLGQGTGESYLKTNLPGGLIGAGKNATIPVEKNGIYTYSAYIYSTEELKITNVTPLHFWVQGQGSNTTQYTVLKNTGGVVPAGVWTRIVTVFKVNGVDGLNFTPIIYQSPIIQEVYVKNFQLEKGNIVTAWNPSIEDTEIKIMDQEVYYEYSQDGQAWHIPPLQSTDNYQRIKKGTGLWSIPVRITGVPGEKGKDGVQLYTWIRYADSPTSGISASPVNKNYVGYAYNKISINPSNNYSDYDWQLTKGNTGEQGVPGAKGQDGIQLYNWIRYADSPTSGISASPVGKSYMGIAVNKTSITPSNNYSDYDWQLTKGNTGEQGVPGKAGQDGRTPFTHTAYANSIDGKKDFHLSNSINRSYWGTYTDYTIQDSTDPTKYKWIQVRGDAITSKIEPVNKYEGMLWIDSSKSPFEQKVWNGNRWEVVGLTINDFEVGGRNLIQNSGNFKTTEHWKSNGGGISLGQGTGESYLKTNLPGGLIGAGKNATIPVEKNGIYTYSAYIYSTEELKITNVTPLHFWVQGQGSNTTQYTVLKNTGGVVPAGVWTRIVTVFKVNGVDGLNFTPIIYQSPIIQEVYVKNFQLEKGNIVTAWNPSIEDTEADLEAIREKNRQQERDINNLNTTTNLLNQKTNYLTTTTQGNVITTGTTEVGDANGNAKAGMTGVASPNPSNISQNRRVVFYAGTGFANRENAKIQIWDDGKFVATDVLLTGIINAIGGTFKNVTAENLTVTSGTFTGTMNAKAGYFGNLVVTGKSITNQPQGVQEVNNMLLWVRNRVGNNRFKNVLIGGYSEESPDNIRQDVGALQVYSQADEWNQDHIGSSFEVVGGKPDRRMAIKVKGGGIGNLGGTAVAIQISSFLVTHESTIIYTGTGTLELNLPFSDMDRYDGRQVTVRNKYRNTYIRVLGRDAGIWFFDTQNASAWGAVTIGPKTTTVTFTYVDGDWYVTNLYGWN
ncbi:hypothetical protein HX049_08015 [Myroides odoratimimus]|uniref:hypothetical protein n=1 Tax=Myroides odoratimimus TaxID=76832 RepID=UPI002578BD0A|nr:hypothetical protein [Myroides odoratimimus]MDM1397119.1 hypothetical protein [Myroides odoratimimus]